ncbi:glycine betaine ABC transporter substrate-binding protein, partial [Sphingomonas sp.]|uniref:glycine betaine ABC transporter substrate-binding protein n=1 Tax=Sphingomonas sp. TaxID=28214 RepID=UPI003B3BB093
ALAAAALLGLIQLGLAAREPRRVGAGAVLLAVAVLAAATPLLRPPAPTVTIGAKNFSEQYILARLIGLQLERAGYRVRYREGLGSAVALRALTGGEIDVYVEYAGTLWTGPMHETRSVPRAAMLRGIGRWLKDGPGGRLVGPLGFENAYALAVRRDARIATIGALADRAGAMTLGADLEFLDRPEWRALRAAYGLRFGATRAYSPTFMYRALASGQVDVISAFSSDGRIAADKLVVLRDPRGAIPRYDAILLASPAHARDGRFIHALGPLVDAIPVDAMRRANLMVDRDADKASPDAAARWLDRAIRSRSAR